MEAGEECDCGSVQVRDWCWCQVGGGERRGECEGGSGWGGSGLALSLRPSGVQPHGRELLQEMHPDSRRHVQRRALLSPLQGEGDPPLGREGAGTGRDWAADVQIGGGT